MARLFSPKSPNLPLATPEYTRSFHDQFSNTLRLFFNQLDNALGALLGTRGARFLEAPYGAFHRDTEFNFTTADTATLITMTHVTEASGMTVDLTDGVHVESAGVYNYQYSVQFSNTDAAAHNAYLWLKKNGSDAAETGSKFDVPSKHGSSNGYLLATCNFYIELDAGDYVELWGAASQVENGVTDGVYLDSYAAQVAPFPRPSIPSVIVTLTFVSRLPP